MTLKELLESDLPTFFDTSEFAITATIGGQSVPGIFDPGLAGDREPRSPQFRCQESLVGINHGGEIIIEGQTYWLEGYQPDGHGVVDLILRRS